MKRLLFLALLMGLSLNYSSNIYTGNTTINDSSLVVAATPTDSHTIKNPEINTSPNKPKNIIKLTNGFSSIDAFCWGIGGTAGLLYSIAPQHKKLYCMLMITAFFVSNKGYFYAEKPSKQLKLVTREHSELSRISKELNVTFDAFDKEMLKIPTPNAQKTIAKQSLSFLILGFAAFCGKQLGDALALLVK